ncbi:hypothetical protein PsYK624_114180 [Phanerochaete sordida]|uniref:Uncharacterized protein n=1 Tax=Phanerochaete sordida TaxID=48140 RepID=A0A9P3GI78_9APHY|nr:hypothetical protein PsYK624_114180 [Phanerochaete sordida]
MRTLLPARAQNTSDSTSSACANRDARRTKNFGRATRRAWISRRLGLPFTTDPDILKSEHHCLNRVRTLEQTTPHWLPGGLTGGALPYAPAFFGRLEGIVARTHA